MTKFGTSFWLLILSTFLSIGFLNYIVSQKNRKQLQNVFILNLVCTLIISIGVLLQAVFSTYFSCPAIWFESIIYIGTCFLPLSVFFTSSVFVNTKIRFKRYYLLLFIIPILSLIIIWTNSFHHLFYVNYSSSFTDTVYGPYFYVHTIYSYLLLFTGVLRLLRFSIKNSGVFSKQSILFCIGLACPIMVNVLGSFLKIIPMTVFETPISFSISIICFALAIFKFNFLGVAPIALQKIVDRISDSYIVIEDNNNIVDFNKTFIDTFKLNSNKIRGKNIFEFFKKNSIYNLESKKIREALRKVKHTDQVVSFEVYIENIQKYFSIEITNIYSNNQSLGILILFKDITQHKLDIQTIKDTQDSLMESERLSSLGQLIGGIAHNLKTPIMSIAGAAEGLTDLVKEYDESIDDPTVNSQDHHEIAKDMSKWIVKIKEYSEYMSDVITAVKGQAVAMSNEDDITFTVSELVKRVNILMKHELKNAIISLNIKCYVDENLSVHGDVNNLVQVINNMISNAIQAYNGKKEETIEFIISQNNNNIIFSIEDHAGGLPKKVQEKLFKEMITTKGKNGTGLGLYMSYSTIKAHFNGNITYQTQTGKGTRFDITIPIK